VSAHGRPGQIEPSLIGARKNVQRLSGGVSLLPDTGSRPAAKRDVGKGRHSVVVGIPGLAPRSEAVSVPLADKMAAVPIRLG